MEVKLLLLTQSTAVSRDRPPWLERKRKVHGGKLILDSNWRWQPSGPTFLTEEGADIALHCLWAIPEGKSWRAHCFDLALPTNTICHQKSKLVMYAWSSYSLSLKEVEVFGCFLNGELFVLLAVVCLSVSLSVCPWVCACTCSASLSDD